MLQWAVVSIFFVGSSYLLVTADTSKEIIEAIMTFVIDFFLVFILWNKERPIVKRFLDRF